MKYWRINTDSKARSDFRTCDLWYKFGMAFAGDFEKDLKEGKLKHDSFFKKVSPGDGVFMHHSNLGIVGYGIVKEEWNSNIYRGAERRLYNKEDCEYRVAISWDANCDCRKNPLPIKDLLPYMGTYSYINPQKWDIDSVLQDLRKRASSR